ncbi:MAG: prepilin-type N-terminal cleavage/methylation domain-containing protein [Patescibacteria group bacterium]
MEKGNTRGFTLIELLVAMSIFIVVITIVFGLFSSAIKGQRRVIAMQNIQENARFMLEFMAKEIRMSIINSPDGVSDTLSITRSDGDDVVYAISNGRIFRDSPSSDDAISAEEVFVTGNFFIEGVGIDDTQPKVTIEIKVQGIGDRPEEQAFIDVQTTLSQRVLDI